METHFSAGNVEASVVERKECQWLEVSETPSVHHLHDMCLSLGRGLNFFYEVSKKCIAS
jgi:hypothetical protein